jgi:hypothetical protein
MWHWIKRLRDWAMSEYRPLQRLSSQPQALHYSYEKGGLVIPDQPVPWNAEAVLVEVLVRMSQNYRIKSDFTIRMAGAEAIAAESLRSVDSQPDRFHVVYRLPPLSASTVVEVRWRDRTLGQLTIPVVARDAFVDNLRMQMPLVFARLGDETVACQTFVSTQCKGLYATGMLTSPTCLAPLPDLDLVVEFRSEREGAPYRFPVRLSSSQLNGRQALVSVAPRHLPRRMGVWIVSWLMGDRCLASVRIKAISATTFQKSLRVSDTRFLVVGDGGECSLSRQLPLSMKERPRAGPCFLVSSREQGMAGLCNLTIRTQANELGLAPVIFNKEVLITDGPTAICPGTIDLSQFSQFHGFELCLRNRLLGSLPMQPAPNASFNAEGAFRPTAEFQWSPIAEDELAERLGHLIEGGTER